LTGTQSLIWFSDMITTLIGNNQVTLPADLVRELGWRPGTRLVWRRLDDHSLVVRSVSTRGERVRRAMGLAAAELKSGGDPVAGLQASQEADETAVAFGLI